MTTLWTEHFAYHRISVASAGTGARLSYWASRTADDRASEEAGAINDG
jgi:hypothetical protein